MAYGFQQLDGSGNVLVDSSAPTVHMLKIWDQQTITLYPPGLGTSVRTYALTGVLNNTDFRANYIIVRTDKGTLWQHPYQDISHAFSFYSPGYIQATFNAKCYTWNFGWQNIFYPSTNQEITCTANHYQTQTFNIYSLGKTL